LASVAVNAEKKPARTRPKDISLATPPVYCSEMRKMMLELERARKYYASPVEPVHAVDDVCMSVDACELVAVFGPSGSGKTTLLTLAAGLMRADAGSVRFEGRDLAEMSKQETLTYRRTQLGFVFQSFNLVAGLTAQENVAVPLLLRGNTHREARRRALAALEDVGLDKRARHTPDRLSGGERQRVAIARALVGEPRLVLADEPTGNLDTETGDSVLELLSALPRERGAGMVLVTHDQRVASYANRVLEMRDGRLSEREYVQEEPAATP
jgi:putative ABC transport system ATP-binding protein